MTKLTAIFNGIKILGGVLKNLFLFLFIRRSGETKEVVKGLKKEVKDAKESAKKKNSIKSLDDDTLDDGLRIRKRKSK